MTEFSNWGLTGFCMGLFVMAATKLYNACFLRFFSGCYDSGVEVVFVELPFTPLEVLQVLLIFYE